MFLLLLSDQTQRQTQRLWEDVWLPGVRGEKGEVDELLLFVNTEDKNRQSCRLKIATKTTQKNDMTKLILTMAVT